MYRIFCENFLSNVSFEMLNVNMGTFKINFVFYYASATLFPLFLTLINS